MIVTDYESDGGHKIETVHRCYSCYRTHMDEKTMYALAARLATRCNVGLKSYALQYAYHYTKVDLPLQYQQEMDHAGVSDGYLRRHIEATQEMNGSKLGNFFYKEQKCLQC